MAKNEPLFQLIPLYCCAQHYKGISGKRSLSLAMAAFVNPEAKSSIWLQGFQAAMVGSGGDFLAEEREDGESCTGERAKNYGSVAVPGEDIP